MKSPWRFLADLTSRSKKEPAALRLPAPDSTAAASMHEPELTPAVLAPTATPGASNGHADSMWANSAQLPVAEKNTLDQPKEAGTLPSKIEQPADPVITRVPATTLDVKLDQAGDGLPLATGVKDATRVKHSNEAPTPSALGIEAAEPQMPARQPLGVFGEASVLDAEITELKAVLVKKLKQQNAQLKMMLARYDDR